MVYLSSISVSSNQTKRYINVFYISVLKSPETLSRLNLRTAKRIGLYPILTVQYES